MGVDIGSKTAGISVVREDGFKLFAAEVPIRMDVVKRIAQRTEYRSSRRNGKVRRGKATFLNRGDVLEG